MDGKAPSFPQQTVKSIKELAEMPGLKTIPCAYSYFNSSSNDSLTALDPQDSLPVIDYSLLTSNDPDQRPKMIEQLDKACQEWGFFMVVNHGIPETLMKAMIDACHEFFKIPQEEKQQLEGKHVLDPIRYGTSFNVSNDKIFFWRDYVKVIVHPEFSCPNKPENLRDLLSEYSQRSREVLINLLKGVSKSLGLDDMYMHNELNLDSSLQIFVANYYPPCPQPELAIGMPPHSDHGLLTMLIQNDIGGLQIQHKGKWMNVNTNIPNAILVNVGDHLEIFSNGIYKSVLHRALVKNKQTRMSLVFANGPSLDTIVRPAPHLVSNTKAAAYIPMKYKNYLELQQSGELKGKSCLDRVKN